MARDACKLCAIWRLGGLAFCVLLPILLTACATAVVESKTAVINSGQVKGAKKSEFVPDLLVPWQTVTGGRLATKLDANGFPMPGAVQGFAAFISPTALAARGADLYVADSGARKLYRVDAMAQVMSVVPGVVAMPWTQMQVGSDLSLYVLDPQRLAIKHYTRGMQPLQTLGDPSATISLNGFVLDVPLGQIVASDRMSQRLVMFSPLGGPALPLIPSAVGGFKALGALASDGRVVYAIDGACSCVAVMGNAGQVSERIGQGVLVQPRALAVDRRGHVFVTDAADRMLKVFLSGQLIASYSAQTLNLLEMSALAVDEDILYVADGAGSRVISFRIQTQIGER